MKKIENTEAMENISGGGTIHAIYDADDSSKFLAIVNDGGTTHITLDSTFGSGVYI